MDFRKETERLNTTTIKRVGELLGLKLPLRGTVKCPLPDHDDKNPSFEVKKNGTRWNCYGCETNGGAIDLIKLYRGVNFLTAKRWLAQQIGDTVNPPSRVNIQGSLRRSKSTASAISEQTEENPPDHIVYEAVLQRSPLQQRGRDYLLARGLSPTTINAQRIGEIDDSRALLDHLVREFGYQRVEAAGLLTKRSSRNDIRLVFSTGTLIFPFTEDHRVAYLQTRQVNLNPRLPKWGNLTKRKRRIYNLNAFQGPKDVPFAICEGIIDALSAIELGYCSIGLLGASAALERNQIKMLRGRRVHILLDWDRAGERRAAEIQHELRRYGIVSVRKSQPSSTATDVNDYLCELGRKHGTV